MYQCAKYLFQRSFCSDTQTHT